MITLKFGGTSMGDAGRILDSADIMISRLEQDSISVIVSAVAGVSNRLQDSIEGSLASGQMVILFLQAYIIPLQSTDGFWMLLPLLESVLLPFTAALWGWASCCVPLLWKPF